MFPSLRPALPADTGALAALDALCNPSPWTAAQFQAAIGSPLDTVLLAEHGDETVGLLVWRLLAGEAELHLIAVAPHCRRQGVAAALMRRMFQAASDAGAAQVFLEVRAATLPAQALYRRFGFAETARRRLYYGSEDALIFQAALPAAVPPNGAEPC